MIRPISSPASSWRKWPAFSITRGAGKLSCDETRSPTDSGSAISESAQSTRLGRQDQREGAGTRLRLRAREGCLVSGNHVIAGVAFTAGLHEEPHRDIGISADVVAEFEPSLTHLLLAGERAGLHDHQTRKTIGVLNRKPQTDRPAPIVDDRSRVANVELLQQRRHQLDVTVVRVPVEVGRLIGTTEASVVRRDTTVTGVAYRRNYFAPEERPGRLAVKEHHRLPLPLVEVGEPQPVDLAVVRFEGKVR